MYDELHVKTSDPILINGITDEFNNTINIIDLTNADVEYLKMYTIDNNSEIIYQLDITEDDIYRFL